MIKKKFLKVDLPMITKTIRDQDRDANTHGISVVLCFYNEIALFIKNFKHYKFNFVKVGDAEKFSMCDKLAVKRLR